MGLLTHTIAENRLEHTIRMIEVDTHKATNEEHIMIGTKILPVEVDFAESDWKVRSYKTTEDLLFVRISPVLLPDVVVFSVILKEWEKCDHPAR